MTLPTVSKRSSISSISTLATLNQQSSARSELSDRRDSALSASSTDTQSTQSTLPQQIKTSAASISSLISSDDPKATTLSKVKDWFRRRGKDFVAGMVAGMSVGAVDMAVGSGMNLRNRKEQVRM